LKPYTRHKARSYVLQALYENLLSGNSVSDIEVYFITNYNFNKTDVEYFQKLLRGVASNPDELDQHITPHLDRPIKQITPIELIALRIATFELIHCPEVPYRVVINEALELTKKFGAQDGHKYVNGILDRVAKELRKIEM
jgi:transcription antitermination protein NusB